MKGKRLLRPAMLVALVVATAIAAFAQTLSDETLHYKVMYKWGVINKCAGRATVSLRNHGEHYRLQLTAASEPWADRFYTVRDTLLGIVARDGYRPLRYEKMAHEGKDDKHDVVEFHYGPGDLVRGDCQRRKVSKGVLRDDATLQLEARGTVVDMLSSFWYMRSLDYDNWKPGQSRTITIFSGKQKELLTFSYHGIEDVKIDNVVYPCYHITFLFTRDGRKRTSEDMDAWISTGPQRLPLKLEGELPVGKVQCYLEKQ